MGWDFEYVVDGEPIDECILNCTFNVSILFYNVIKGGVKVLNGKTGKQARPILDHAIILMIDDREFLQKLLLGINWGSYEGALRVLKVLRSWCFIDSRAVFVVS